MEPSEFIPLQEPTFFILLSLAPGHKHGYAILKEVESLSAGKVTLSTGTLYGALSRLLDQWLIERVPPEEATANDSNGESSAHPGKARKAYRLTPGGRKVLEAETRRLQDLLSVAQRQMTETSQR